MMRVAIFEDEPHNAERLTHLLEQCSPATEVIAVIDSVAKGRTWLREVPPVDLLLMDIQLSDGNCFELFDEQLLRTPVIFTTAYDSFALQAFKVNSIDYLLKPIDQADLQRALTKWQQLRTDQYSLDVGRLAEAFMRRDHTRFLGRINNQLIYVKATDIAYVQFAKGITWAITFAGQKWPLDYSLDQIEQMLDRHSFFRINRQFIVQVDAIKKITTYYNSRLILQLEPAAETDVLISRDRVTAFKSWLEGRPVP
jgi:two-component system response regulator LytT